MHNINFSPTNGLIKGSTNIWKQVIEPNSLCRRIAKDSQILKHFMEVIERNLETDKLSKRIYLRDN
jgi:hypothetical protein